MPGTRARRGRWKLGIPGRRERGREIQGNECLGEGDFPGGSGCLQREFDVRLLKTTAFPGSFRADATIPAGALIPIVVIVGGLMVIPVSMRMGWNEVVEP